MKFSNTYKTISVILTFLILFSSTSYSIEKHICKGETHRSLFNDAESLCNTETASYHTESTESTCCLNTSEFIRGINLNQQAQVEQKISIAPVLFLFSDFFIAKLQAFQTFSQNFLFIKQYPKLPDLRILFQVFRI